VCAPRFRLRQFMTTVEVNEKKWRQFCQQLEEFCRGALVKVQVKDGEGLERTVAHDVPLRRVELDDQSDACNTRLVIEAGLADQSPIRHVVLEPIHIRLKNSNGSGRYNRVQILAENGTTTMELHPGLSEALLKALEL